jgi:hypothetical protein
MLLCLAAACAAGLAMTSAIGARRAGSAWERFARDTNSPDLFTSLPVEAGDAALADVLTRPGVRAAALMSYMSVFPQGRVPDDAQQPGAFVGLSADFGTVVYRPLILRGRGPDPARADEFTINEAMANLTGLQPGDQVTLLSYPDSVRQLATVVGIQAGPFDVTLNSAQPLALLTPAFGLAWFDRYVASLPSEVRSQYTKVLLASVPSQLDRKALLADGFFPGRAFGSEAIAGLDAQRTAFSVLAIAGAIGTLVATGQAISRRVWHEADQLPILAALGLTPLRRQIAVAAAPWTAAAIGFACSPMVAFVASPLVSTGVARRLEIDRPHVVDFAVMLPGLSASLLVVGVGAWAAARRTDSQPRATRPHPAPVRLPGAAGLFGGRVASGWGEPAARTTARSHVVAVVLGIAVITGVAVWSGAARHVFSTPSWYGVDWDASIGPGEDVELPVDPSVLDAAAARLSADPSVGTTLASVVAGMYEGPAGETEIIKIDRQSGRWWPTVVAGRAPTADDEITIGPGMTDGGLGDTLDIEGRTFHVVGRHVVAPLSNGSPGSSIAVSADAVRDLSLTAPDVRLLVQLTAGASPDDLRRVAGDKLAVYEADDSPPGDVGNLARTAGLIDVLLAACAALGVAAFANGLIVATRARRADYATLRALGARPRTIAGSLAWHGGLVAVIGAALGIPLGVIVGRTVWRRTASGINSIPDLWRWDVVAAVVAAATIVVAAIVVAATAAIPGRRRGARPAE